MKLASLALLAFFALTACGSDSPGDKCKDTCPKTCPGDTAPTAAEITNCETACDEIQARAKRSGCEDEISALYDCNDKHMCSATLVSDCSSEGTAVNECYTVYCRSHTSDPDC